MSEELKRPDWMTSISANVNPDDYLSGRKIDKTFELYQQEKAEKAKEIRVNLIASDKLKLTGDPMLDLERRKYQLKLDIISNPIRLRQFRDRLLEERRKKEGMSEKLPTHESLNIDGNKRLYRSKSRSPERDRSRRSHDRSREDISRSIERRSTKRNSKSPSRSNSRRYKSRSPHNEKSKKDCSRLQRHDTSYRDRLRSPRNERTRRSSSTSSDSSHHHHRRESHRSKYKRETVHRSHRHRDRFSRRDCDRHDRRSVYHHERSRSSEKGRD